MIYDTKIPFFCFVTYTGEKKNSIFLYNFKKSFYIDCKPGKSSSVQLEEFCTFVIAMQKSEICTESSRVSETFSHNDPDMLNVGKWLDKLQSHSANIYCRINTAFGSDPNEFSTEDERLTRATTREFLETEQICLYVISFFI